MAKKQNLLERGVKVVKDGAAYWERAAKATLPKKNTRAPKSVTSPSGNNYLITESDGSKRIYDPSGGQMKAIRKSRSSNSSKKKK